MYSGPSLRTYAEAVAHEESVKPMRKGSSYAGCKPLGDRKKPYIQIRRSTTQSVQVGYLGKSAAEHNYESVAVEYHADGRIELGNIRWQSDVEVIQGTTGLNLQVLNSVLWVHNVIGTTGVRGSYRLTAPTATLIQKPDGLHITADNLLTKHVVDRKQMGIVRKQYAEFRRYMKNTLNVCEGHLHDVSPDNLPNVAQVRMDLLKQIRESTDYKQELNSLAALVFHGINYWDQRNMRKAGYIVATYKQADAALQDLIKHDHPSIFVPELAEVGVMCIDHNAKYVR